MQIATVRFSLWRRGERPPDEISCLHFCSRKETCHRFCTFSSTLSERRQVSWLGGCRNKPHQPLLLFIFYLSLSLSLLLLLEVFLERKREGERTFQSGECRNSGSSSSSSSAQQQQQQQQQQQGKKESRQRQRNWFFFSSLPRLHFEQKHRLPLKQQQLKVKKKNY